MEQTDLVIPCAPKDAFTLERAVSSVRRHIGDPSGTYIICSDLCRHVIEGERMRLGKARVLCEDSVVNGLSAGTVAGEMASLGMDPSNAGWYFQQFLKLGFALTDWSAGRYLVLDADAAFLRRMDVVSETGAARMGTCGFIHRPYFDAMGRLFGRRREPSRSYCVDYMLFDPVRVAEMLASIGPDWWERMLRAAAGAKNGFSEYETYAGYMEDNHPEEISPFELDRSPGGAEIRADHFYRRSPEYRRSCLGVIDRYSRAGMESCGGTCGES